MKSTWGAQRCFARCARSSRRDHEPLRPAAIRPKRPTALLPCCPAALLHCHRELQPHPPPCRHGQRTLATLPPRPAHTCHPAARPPWRQRTAHDEGQTNENQNHRSTCDGKITMLLSAREYAHSVRQAPPSTHISQIAPPRLSPCGTPRAHTSPVSHRPEASPHAPHQRLSHGVSPTRERRRCSPLVASSRWRGPHLSPAAAPSPPRAFRAPE